MGDGSDTYSNEMTLMTDYSQKRTWKQKLPPDDENPIEELPSLPIKC